jgi:cellobiose phosphorylase
MYRLITESLLGLQLDGDKLRFNPRPPKDWESYTIHYRYRDTTYHIAVINHGDGTSERHLRMDGIELTEGFIPLVDDHVSHEIEIRLNHVSDPPDSIPVSGS